ncbi:MAG: hypothetical protein WBZ37_30430 [Mycobacterium sp.]
MASDGLRPRPYPTSDEVPGNEVPLLRLRRRAAAVGAQRDVGRPVIMVLVKRVSTRRGHGAAALCVMSSYLVPTAD